VAVCVEVMEPPTLAREVTVLLTTQDSTAIGKGIRYLRFYLRYGRSQ